MDAPITDEQAKAMQETAKAVNSVAEAAQGLGRFVARIVGAPTEQAAGLLADKLRYMRAENALGYMQKLRQKMAESDPDSMSRYLPLNVVSPILEQMVLEEEEDAQELWANLLVNGIDSTCETEVTKSIVGILRELGSIEAKCLNTIVQAIDEGDSFFGVPVYGLPDRVMNREFYDVPEVPESLQIALQNLIRLGCIEVCHMDGASSIYESGVLPTVIGNVLVRVCTRTRVTTKR